MYLLCQINGSLLKQEREKQSTMQYNSIHFQVHLKCPKVSKYACMISLGKTEGKSNPRRICYKS